MRVLLVDDTRTELLLTSTLLKKAGYEVVTASDGQEAWDILLEDPIPMVISDWMMPKIDGPELCRMIRGHRFNHYIYLILLTGLTDRDSLIAGMEAGADDFLTKPVNPAELRVRMHAGERVIGLEATLAERNRRLSEANDELERLYKEVEKDLQSAEDMQRALLPAPMRWGNANLDWMFQPSTFVAGDILDYFPMNDDLLCFYNLDVSGHGIPAALLSFTLHKVLNPGRTTGNIFKATGDEDISPAKAVALLNERYIPTGDSAQYFTMVFGVFNRHSGEVTLTQAGHPPPIHLKHASGEAVSIGEGGFPVGMIPGMEYDDIHFTLEPGDRLYLYSDGILEAGNADAEQFGEERLRALLSTTTRGDLKSQRDALREAIESFTGKQTPEDDITMLIIEYKPDEDGAH